MQQRRVTAPDGTKWIVGRRWLLARPRYFGFRFGVDRSRAFEPPLAPPRERVTRTPAPTKPPTRPPVRYETTPSRTRVRTGGGGWLPTSIGSGRSGRSRSSGSGLGGLFRGSSGGGSRGGSSGGGSRSGSSGGGKRGGGGAAGAGAALLAVLRYVLIVVAVILAALFVVFVLIPSLLFLIHYLAFWLVVVATIVYRGTVWPPMDHRDGRGRRLPGAGMASRRMESVWARGPRTCERRASRGDARARGC